MYYVVEYPDCSVEVVPDNWLIEKGSLTWWPQHLRTNSSAFGRAVENKLQPADDWQRCRSLKIWSKHGSIRYFVLRTVLSFTV